MNLTPCQVLFNGVDLGGTLGEVKVHIQYKKAPIKADQYGDTVLDRRVSGIEISVETELAEIANKANWAAAFPHMAIVGSSTAGYLYSKIGESDSSKAQTLILHPLSQASSDKSQDLKFYKAVAEAVSDFTYGSSKQMGLKVKWNILPDTSTSPPQFLFLGDPSTGLVAASAAAPSFTGTGSGTVTAVTVANGITRTETITVKCVGASTGNDFYVSGSLSGPLGEVHIAAANLSTVNFTSGPINFTINQGATQFVFGDQFTIATTASNYA